MSATWVRGCHQSHLTTHQSHQPFDLVSLGFAHSTEAAALPSRAQNRTASSSGFSRSAKLAKGFHPLEAMPCQGGAYCPIRSY